ncbi:hypothetical protein [Glaciecola petra]|uniref:Uncharacterized protein n=1 Tax=Glaciecola petra TaxID=3075602 RepID=A0ABU2ZP23_9ALTE|nr:hypothetical protein [Aestuariibacter sp. P117]MDT0594374.1 hypothetical protein [Aestuariibacter sp. P117]
MAEEALYKTNDQHPLSSLEWSVTTISPIDIAFSLPLGFAKDSDQTREIIAQIVELVPTINAVIPKHSKQLGSFVDAEYLSLEDDVSSLALFSWAHEVKGNKVKFHIFPNSIAIAEVILNQLYANDAQALDDLVLDHTKTILDEAYTEFDSILVELEKSLTNSEAIFDRSGAKAKVYWPSRSLILNEDQTKDVKRAPIIKDWLAETLRKSDAQRIINGEIQHSMTWIKYIVVDSPSENGSGFSEHKQLCLDTMILAQYCYTAQEKCNRQLRQAIEWAFKGEKKKLESQLQRAKRSLEKGRVVSKLHSVEVNECLRHLNRKKRELIEDIFKCWEYERLVENGNVMLDVCKDKINEANSRQAKISAYKTEYILIGISLFTVLDFFFFVTQFSREAMANPTLDHNDGGPSSFLTIIAEIPADLMFFIGIVAAGLIFITYKKVKG